MDSSFWYLTLTALSLTPLSYHSVPHLGKLVRKTLALARDSNYKYSPVWESSQHSNSTKPVTYACSFQSVLEHLWKPVLFSPEILNCIGNKPLKLSWYVCGVIGLGIKTTFQVGKLKENQMNTFAFWMLRFKKKVLLVLNLKSMKAVIKCLTTEKFSGNPTYNCNLSSSIN